VLLAAVGPHLIDFGISRALDGTALTAAGMVVGTPGFMSPEQAEGVAAGPPSDVFSLGALLAFAATGNAPFGGGSAAAVLYRVVTGQPDLTDVPGQLREIIAGCMAKNPAHRPSLADLRAAISHAGPDLPYASPMSYWPAPVAAVISAAGLSDAAAAMAPAPVSAPASATASMPTASATQWPAPAPNADVLAAYRYGQLPSTRRGMPVAGTVPFLAAARLMYAGAALTLVNAIVALAVIGQFKASVIARHPLMSDSAVLLATRGAVAVVIVESVISIGTWLWLASAARRGRRWVRTVGSVLFGINTLVLLGTIKNPGPQATKGIGIVIWLIGLLAVIALCRRPGGPSRYR
jgi:hypothetical protein